MAHGKQVTISVVLLVAMLAAGCGPAATPTPVATETGGGQQPVVVQYWSNGWFNSSIASRRALVDRFNQEYEGRIQIEYIQGSGENAETYIQGGVAAGGGIACFMETWPGTMQDWYNKGYVIDLRPYMTTEWRALTSEAEWEARTFTDGAIVANATVMEQPTLLLLYNPEMLQRAGVEPATIEDPWSWDELYQYAALLTLDANGRHLGEAGFDDTQVVQWGYTDRFNPEKVIQNGLFYAQGRMGEPVIRQENGRWGWFLDEAGAEAYEDFLSAVVAGVSPPESIGLGGSTMHEMFHEGRVAIIAREAFGIPWLHDTYPDFTFGAMPTPFDEGDRVFYQSGAEGMSITSTCEHPAEAAEYLHWVMRPENLAVYAYGNGMLPANFEALQYEPFASDPTWAIIVNYLERAETFTMPYNPNLTEFIDTVAAPLLVEVAEGTRTFAEANAIIVEQGDQILNR